MKAGLLAGRQAAGLPGVWFEVDASDTSTITHVSGKVTDWADKAPGSSLVLEDATTGTRPTTGTRTQNSLNVIDFVSSTPNKLRIDATTAAALDLGTSNLTTFTVLKFDTNTTSAPWGKHIAATTNGRYGLYRPSAGNLNMMYDNDASTTGEVTATNSSTSPMLVTTRLTRAGASSTHELRINGVLVATKNFTDDGSDWSPVTPFWVGSYNDFSGYYFDGWLGQLIMYNEALSDGDIDITEAALDSKWGLGLGL